VNDLDFIRELRTGLPEPSGVRLAAGRDRLTARIQENVRSRRQPGTSWRVRLALAACVLAAVSVSAVIAGALGPVHHGKADRAALAKSHQFTLAAEMLHTAARTAAGNGATEPAPGQWFYSKTVSFEYRQVPAMQTYEGWETFNGVYTAYYQGATLVVHKSPVPDLANRGTALDQFDNNPTPLTAYRALASLPSDPKALLAVIAAQVAKVGAANIEPGSSISQATSSPDEADFSYLVELMWNATDSEPSAVQASVFDAVAAMPGVSVQQGVTDAAGQQAVAVSDDGGFDQLLLNPATYAVIGIREISTGAGPKMPTSTAKIVATLLHGLEGAKLRAMRAELRSHEKQLVRALRAKALAAMPPPRGTVVESLATAEVAAVSGPGAR
jgi:hypothetical protein